MSKETKDIEEELVRVFLGHSKSSVDEKLVAAIKQSREWKCSWHESGVYYYHHAGLMLYVVNLPYKLEPPGLEPWVICSAPPDSGMEGSHEAREEEADSPVFDVYFGFCMAAMDETLTRLHFDQEEITRL